MKHIWILEEHYAKQWLPTSICYHTRKDARYMCKQYEKLGRRMRPVKYGRAR